MSKNTDLETIDVVKNQKIYLCEYRGWKISAPYPIHTYCGFRIVKGICDFSVIFGYGFMPTKKGDPPYFEINCADWYRSTKFDDIIDVADEEYNKYGYKSTQ